MLEVLKGYTVKFLALRLCIHQLKLIMFTDYGDKVSIGGLTGSINATTSLVL